MIDVKDIILPSCTFGNLKKIASTSGTLIISEVWSGLGVSSLASPPRDLSDKSKLRILELQAWSLGSKRRSGAGRLGSVKGWHLRRPRG